MGHIVKLKKVYLCNNPSRQTIWKIKLHLPVDHEQFYIIDRIIHSLSVARDNFLIVDFEPSIHTASYIQISRDHENDYYMELHFDSPCVFSYRFNEKNKIRKHPWSNYYFRTNTPKAASAIFKKVLCFERLPDLSTWKNCTRRIYMEGLMREHRKTEDKPHG